MLQPGRDYEIDRAGRWIFTAAYLRARGYCCFQGCRNCPWGQAGLSAQAAQAVLRTRLEALQQGLDAAGLALRVRHCADGVLQVHSPEGAPTPPPPERQELTRQVSQLAEGLLHLRAVAWPGLPPHPLPGSSTG